MTNTDAARELLDWYDRNRRTLPWRAEAGNQPDPYHVWLSEVMLQQTTVATVKSYFAKFLDLWPTVEALAAAPLEAVLEAWAGLGYYARARNLHKCAGVIAQDYGGRFPANIEALGALPGIGDYTANAIGAIAFGLPGVVVDGNVERVIARLHRIETPLPAAKPEIKRLTADIAPRATAGRPGDFAQAMMDLGATLCTPKTPQCLLCPWQGRCAALKAGDMLSFPKKMPKKPKPTRRIVAFWLEADGHILLERRPAKGLLGGMPGLFASPWEERADYPEDWQHHAPHAGDWQLIAGEARHTFTHFHLEARLARLTLETRINSEVGFWQPVDALGALPTAFAKMVALRDG